MSSCWQWMATGMLVLAVCIAQAADGRRDYPVSPVPLWDVQLIGGFWSARLETNRTVTIPYAFKKCEETGRIDNFAKAGGLMEGPHVGIFFNDSDVFKIIEGAAYSLHTHPDPQLDKYVDDVIAKIAAAQEDDGYLYTARTINPDKPPSGSGPTRWSNLGASHELYNVGHLYEAAAAHYLATGKRTLLDVALKNADLVASVFGPDKKRDVPGHEEIEVGLVKLFRVTGEAKYLDLAKFFLDERGQPSGRRLYGPYAQDHQPVVEQREAVGHAVRAMYLYSGMADVAALTGDPSYVRALDRIWEDVVRHKYYVIGGIGARGAGEAFGIPYELPNLVAYNETCAAIGNVLWNHRMFLLHRDAKYLDVLERTLYNGLISGIGMDGKSFFYPNVLQSHGQHQRSPWFDCACCPSNDVRFIPQVPGFAYATAEDALYVNLFVASRAIAQIGDHTVEVKQETDYPWDGRIRIALHPQRPAEFTLYVRIPGWARNEPVPSDLYRFLDTSDQAPILRLNGSHIGLNMQRGFASLRRQWRKGDEIELDLPMPVRRVVAHEKVEEDAGKVALQRGPIVYCAEWPDNKDGHVLNLLLPDDAPLEAEYRGDLLNGVVVIRGPAFGLQWAEDGKSVLKQEQELVAIPYYAWAHRGPGQMAVWLAHEESAARPLPAPTIASTSRLTVSGGTNPGAICDQIEAKSSIDHSVPFFHWWPRKGTLEWVQYEFQKPETVSTVEVYWFDDTGRGECRVPASWRVLYRQGQEWKPVANKGEYGVAKDRYNRVEFTPVTTDALRLEVQLAPNVSAGIHEWIVK